jgi:putative DNA primase/helicase
MQRLRTLDFRPNQNGELRPVTLPIDAAALDAFGEWRELHHDASQAMTGLAASAYGKMPGAALRLALVLELLWWASGPADAAEPTSVSGDALGAAIDLIEGYVKPMLVRVLGEASLPTVDRHTAALGREIIKRRVTVINARDVRREWRLPGMREASAVSAAISALVEAGWLVPIPTRDGGTAGRQRQDYAVDPRVHGGAS